MHKESLKRIEEAARAGFYDTAAAHAAAPYLAVPHQLALSALGLIRSGVTEPQELAEHLDCSPVTAENVVRALAAALPLGVLWLPAGAQRPRMPFSTVAYPAHPVSEPPTARMTASPMGDNSPHPQLVEVLSAAYRCTHFDGACTEMRWDPAAGHFPRGCCGATGRLEEVRLVIVLEEPGNPHEEEKKYLEEGQLCEFAASYAYGCYRSLRGRVHERVRRYLLDEIWPGLDFDDQMRRVWITESMLCSKPDERWNHRAPRRTCVGTYLRRQLALLPNAVIAVLGKGIWAYVPPSGERPVIHAVSASARISLAELRFDWYRIVEVVHRQEATQRI